jgi:hypothetical protein
MRYAAAVLALPMFYVVAAGFANLREMTHLRLGTIDLRLLG